MIGLGKAFLAVGLLTALIGVVLIIASRTGLPLGRLPGDIAYRDKSVSIFIPLGTCVLLCIVLSVLLYLLARFQR
jgi:hypothetical protein